MNKEKIGLARKGEALAEGFLKKNKYKILLKNYRNNYGEIDIIGQDKDTLCFIEVKTRSTQRFGSPHEAIDAHKRRKISQVALKYLKDNRFLDRPARFDTVAIYTQEKQTKIELIKNAFSLDNTYTY